MYDYNFVNFSHFLNEMEFQVMFKAVCCLISIAGSI